MLKPYPRIRLALYLLALAGSVVAPFVAVTSPDYAAAVVTASGVLNVAALGTAATNRERGSAA